MKSCNSEGGLLNRESYRVQRADEAASVALVCVERLGTTTDSWIPVLCRATMRPLSQHKSADLRMVLTTVSSCVCTLDLRKIRVCWDYLDSEITPYFSLLFHINRFTQILESLVISNQCVHASCFLAQILILLLCSLIFSSPLTFSLLHSWGHMTAGLFFWATSEPPTVTVQLSL